MQKLTEDAKQSQKTTIIKNMFSETRIYRTGMAQQIITKKSTISHRKACTDFYEI